MNENVINADFNSEQENEITAQQLEQAQNILNVTSQININACNKAIDIFTGGLYQILMSVHIEDPNSKAILAKCQGLNDFKNWLTDRQAEAQQFISEHQE